MKKVLIVLTLIFVACATIACNEPETATISGEGTETIITENVIIEETIT